MLVTHFPNKTFRRRKGSSTDFFTQPLCSLRPFSSHLRAPRFLRLRDSILKNPAMLGFDRPAIRRRLLLKRFSQIIGDSD
jgi:hypothetical protein